MSRIDIYVLSESGEPARHRFACRLAEKAYSLNNSVHIRVTDSQTAEILDDLLWTFRDGSFVPHEKIAGETARAQSPVTIGVVENHACDLLINLTDSMPEDPAAFPRVAEIVTSDENARQASRKRFAEYRDNGHTMDTHKL